MKIHQTALQWQMGRIKRIWYLSPMWAGKVQASLRIRAVSPEPPLLAHTSSESRGTFRQKARSLAPLNVWACAVKICHDGMLEDTNWLEAAQMDLFNWAMRLWFFLSLQTRMHNHPVGLDVWFLVGHFVYFHTSCVRTAKALARLRGYLIAYVISTIISWAGSIRVHKVKMSWSLSGWSEEITRKTEGERGTVWKITGRYWWPGNFTFNTVPSWAAKRSQEWVWQFYLTRQCLAGPLSLVGSESYCK